jgi:hypothetical protein
MKHLFILATIFGLTSCVQNQPSPAQTKSVVTVEGNLNSYEIIRIGDYECVGMDGYKSGGIWCNKLDKKDLTK